MTDDPSTVTHTPAEPPLGIQQPLLPPVPLGQSMLQPKFFTPLGAQSLRVLDPSIFLPASDLAFPNEESSFQDSPFFDAPDSSTPSQPTVPTVQTQPQPRSLKPAPSKINVPTTAPFERIAETPLIETSTVEDLAIAEPLIARSPLAALDTPIVEASTGETPIARTFAVETPIAEDLAIAEPLIARSPIAETDAAIASPFIVEETTTEAIQSAPSEAAAIAQASQSEPLNRFESPSPSISRLSTETPAEHSIDPSISNVSAQDFDPPTETANEYPEAPILERSPFSPDTVVTHTSTQPPDSAAIQRTTNLEDSASPIAPISAENTIAPVVTDLIGSNADSAEPIQPESDSTDNIPSLAPASNPTIASSPPVDTSDSIAASTSAIAQPILDSPATIARLPADESIDPVVDVAEPVPTVVLPPVVDNSESIASTDSPITQMILDLPAAIARLPEDEPIDPVVDVAESIVQPTSDRDSPTNQAEETSLPAALVGERQTEVARLGDPEANVDVVSTPESVPEATIQRSPLETAISEPAMSDREDDTVAAIAAPPVDSPISDVEGIQPKTTNLAEEELENEEFENLAEISLEQSSSEPDINSTKIDSIGDQPSVQPRIQANSSETFSILQHQQDHSEENATSVDAANLLRSTEEAEIQTKIEPEPSLRTSLQNSFRSIEETQDLHALDTESLAQPIALDTPAQRLQPETNTQVDSVTQSNIEPPIQPQAEAESIAAETSVATIQTEALTQTDTQSAPQSLSTEWIDSSSIESESRSIHSPSSDRTPHEVVDRPKALETPSIQPISNIAQPIQRKVADAENILSESGAVENESSLRLDQSSSLPELPSVLQRLSILEPIAQMQSIYTAPVPAVQPALTTRSSVIPEIQTQPFESLFDVPFEAPSVRRKSDVGTNDYVAPTLEAFTPEALTPISSTQDSPVTTEWGNIAELFNPSADFHSTLEPENTLSDDGYPDLMTSAHSTPSDMIQTSAVPPVETAAPVETEAQGDRETSAQPNSSGSPEHLERLAQEVYQLIRQRLALERERGGKSGSGRLL